MTQELRKLAEAATRTTSMRVNAAYCTAAGPEEILALLDRLEKAEKDAERYRWLRDGCDEKGNAASYIAANCYGMEWNALIDTAMEASK